MATLEEASHCPRCSQAGTEVLTSRGPRGSIIHVFNCMNQLCRWFETGWTVQTNADGTVPERTAGDKEFPALTPGQEAMANRYLEEIEQADLRDTGPGS